jgi:hypothetical protein
MPAVRCSVVRPMRGAALLAAATMFLVPRGQAMAQETRAEIIRQEQADKLRTVAPPELNLAEKATGTTTNLGETRASATNVNAPKDLPAAASTYIRVEISANGGPQSWTEPGTRLLPARGGWLDAGWLRTCAGRQSAGKQGRQPRD